MNQIMRVVMMRRGAAGHADPQGIIVSRDNFSLIKNSSQIDTQAFQNTVVKGYMQNDMSQYKSSQDQHSQNYATLMNNRRLS
jgi:hypothetical protein